MRAKPGAPLAVLEAAVASKTNKCIIWKYGKGRDGYGQIRLDGRMKRVSRVVCERVYGPPPTPEHVAAHAPVICHNPLCINPRHLMWATQSENVAHMHDDEEITEKPSGKSSRKLTKAQAVEIFASTEIGVALAERFGVSDVLISLIKYGKHLYSAKLFAVSQRLKSEQPTIAYNLITAAVSSVWAENIEVDELYTLARGALPNE